MDNQSPDATHKPSTEAGLTEEYDFECIEAELQQQWQANSSFKADFSSSDTKFYCLAMFPYPSGQLHMGHVRNYTISDTIARTARLEGKQVFHPMGWDAFGLPAENAALKNKVAPSQWTYQNIASMRAQLQKLGLSVDWSRELATCHPHYYRWEQWLFLQMYEKGLVYKKLSEVNWDPIDKTVLANEQVIDGRGWRSGALVERRKIPQWFLKITAYADQLLDDLDSLEHWPTGVKAMQRNWIGRSQGAQIIFNLDPNQLEPNQEQQLRVFTTRPDTLYGVTYLAVSPQHWLSKAAATCNPALQNLIERMINVKTAEADLATLKKEGYDTGFTALHPFSKKAVPIWVANYVLADYGSGVVMCVPAHDQRDWEFAQLYSLPIQPVIQSQAHPDWDYASGACVDLGTLVHSSDFSGLTSEQAKIKMTAYLEQQQQGNSTTEYRLRDWGVSRQRYWGAPIPMIQCENCGDVPVPEHDLPVVLPDNVTINGEGGSPLAQHPEFYQVACPKCAQDARRETDTFDTFMESSWYYARFLNPHNQESILSEEAKTWTPVDQYVGGIEHATMHLLYSRFIHKVLRDFGLVTSNEPFTRLLCQGMVLSESFHRVSEAGEKIYINRQDLNFELDGQGRVQHAIEKSTGLQVSQGLLEKMSKSKNNGVDPNQLILAYGADTVRLFSMFAAPPEQTLEWSDAGVEGAFRFLKRFWKQTYEHINQNQSQLQSSYVVKSQLSQQQQEMRLHIHTALSKVTDDYTRRQSFNTGIAALMKLSNQLTSFDDSSNTGIAIRQEGLSILTVLLSPIAPHICDKLWHALNGTVLADQRWPELDESALKTSHMMLVIQINGKKRSEIQVDAQLDQATIKQLAQDDVTAIKFLQGQTIVKVIYVPNRLINIVAR